MPTLLPSAKNFALSMSSITENYAGELQLNKPNIILIALCSDRNLTQMFLIFYIFVNLFRSFIFLPNQWKCILLETVLSDNNYADKLIPNEAEKIEAIYFENMYSFGILLIKKIKWFSIYNFFQRVVTNR